MFTMVNPQLSLRNTRTLWAITSHKHTIIHMPPTFALPLTTTSSSIAIPLTYIAPHLHPTPPPPQTFVPAPRFPSHLIISVYNAVRSLRSVWQARQTAYMQPMQDRQILYDLVSASGVAVAQGGLYTAQ